MKQEYFPQISRKSKPSVITEGQFLSKDNFVHPSATAVMVTGSNNSVGPGCSNVILNNCTNCTIDSGLSNVTLSNCTDISVSESNSIYQNGYKINNATVLLDARIELTNAQVKTGNSIPIEVSQHFPTKGIEFVSGVLRYIAGDGLLSCTQAKLIINTATNEQANLGVAINPAVSNQIRFQPTYLGSSYVANQPLMIQFDSDSAAGTGAATVYISYRVINS
jgi:hypothetical protein